MSNPDKSISQLGFRFRDTVCLQSNKPGFKELEMGSPISPLKTSKSGLTASSSSSSGSVSGRNVNNSVLIRLGNGHSDELSMCSERSPIRKPDPLINSHKLSYSGNIIRNAPKTSALIKASRNDVLGSGMGNYGHGSIMRGDSKGTNGRSCKVDVDSEELKREGNEYYKKGNFREALNLYDRAILMSPNNAAYRSNRAAALTGLGRIHEAVKECDEAIKLEPEYCRAHRRLGSLLLRLGHVEIARKHLCILGKQSDSCELHNLRTIEKHLKKCSESRKVGDWKSVLEEVGMSISAGADYSSQLFACRAEALLKLHQLDDADYTLSSIPKFEPPTQPCTQFMSFGMLCEAYFFLVRAQIDMTFGRFESAIIAAERSMQIDPQNSEISLLLKHVKLVSRARARGNNLFKSERFTEACTAYGEGLRLNTSNSVLYCNRAACWYKLGMWDRSVLDCDQALRIQPNYTKALLRRALSNTKLEHWVDAVRDYEVLMKMIPNDDEVSKSLFHAQVALKKSRGEDISNMKFGGEVTEVLDLDQFSAVVSSPGVSIVYFKTLANTQCEQISSFVDILCDRYLSINFFQVDVECSHEVAKSENVRAVPTFKIYKNGVRVNEMICPSNQMLEYSVRHYSF